MHREKTRFHLGGTIRLEKSVGAELVGGVPRAKTHFPRNSQSMYGGWRTDPRLKHELLQAEVIETLLNKCMAWNLKPAPAAKLRSDNHHHCVLVLRCIGWCKKIGMNSNMSYGEALFRAGWPESIKPPALKRRLCYAGFFKRRGRLTPRNA